MSISYLPSIPTSMTATIQMPAEPSETVPHKVEKYLQDMGWRSERNGSKIYYTTTDGNAPGFHSWSEAVAYCLIKPFLEEK